MLSNIMVEMPQKGIVKHKTKKVTYVYHILRAYRDEKGHPTNERIAIGKLDEESGMLIPNKTYYEIYETKTTKEKTEIMKIETSGITAFFENAVKSAGLDIMLKKVFPDKYKKILILAMYMLSEGNVMQHIENWCEQNKTSDDIVVKSQEISKLFESISYDERMQFFKIMSNARIENEFVAYDVTSVSSYSKNMESAAWGYNRDKESLPQINIGMYYGEESKLPLFYTKYPGNINDKSHMKYMLANNDLININKVKFVMDKGFYSKDNIQELNDKHIRYIISIPNNLKIVTETIEKYREDIVLKSNCKLGANLPYGKSIVTNEFGARLKICIYYNQNKANDEIEHFFTELDIHEKKLMNNDELTNSKYNHYFNITEKKGEKKKIVRNEELIDKTLRRLGFFVLLTTEHVLTEVEILEKYRNKDVVEKSFDNLKNEIDMKRLRCHSDETTDGKLFVSYIALIIRAYTYERLKEYMKKSNLSYTSVVKELQKVKQVTFSNNYIDFVPLTKRQREIFECL